MGALKELATAAESATAAYSPTLDRDRVVVEEWRPEAANPLFKAGQSHRIWGELYKAQPFTTRP